MIRNRTTPATVLAGTALLLAVAGSGTAVAAGLAANSVESRHIKDGTIRKADMARGVLDKVELAAWADNADNALYAGQAESADRLLGMSRATVTASGELGPNSEGVVSVTMTSTPGRYLVDYFSPRLGCFLMTSVGHNDTAPVAGSASAWVPAPVAENLGKVIVETHAADGDSTPDPLPFRLLQIC